MSRKEEKKEHQADKKPLNTAPSSPLSKRGWKIVFAGIGVVVLGYIVLSLADPRGQNFASRLSPLLIIGGYTTIGVGIVTKDPTE
jgi:hypothetical protein